MDDHEPARANDTNLNVNSIRSDKMNSNTYDKKSNNKTDVDESKSASNDSMYHVVDTKNQPTDKVDGDHDIDDDQSKSASVDHDSMYDVVVTKDIQDNINQLNNKQNDMADIDDHDS